MEELSEYARSFDEGSKYWSKNLEMNRVFLACQQNYFNDKLQTLGHVFLNEIYDALGLPRTSAGQLVGWLKGEEDGYIEFIIEGNMIDFNVDGVIYEKIGNN